MDSYEYVVLACEMYDKKFEYVDANVGACSLSKELVEEFVEELNEFIEKVGYMYEKETDLEVFLELPDNPAVRFFAYYEIDFECPDGSEMLVLRLYTKSGNEIEIKPRNKKYDKYYLDYYKDYFDFALKFNLRDEDYTEEKWEEEQEEGKDLLTDFFESETVNEKYDFFESDYFDNQDVGVKVLRCYFKD